ncbi:MAG: chemotaxis protein CheA [Desulfohalobiaceae bacterium]
MHQNHPGHEIFLEEAQELLQELETALFEIENTPGDRELVDRIFRALHTIKGSGAMFGYDAVSAFTHEVESVFDLVRNREMEVGKDLLSLTLDAGDHIRRLLHDQEPDREIGLQGQEILDRLGLLRPHGPLEHPRLEKRLDPPPPQSSSRRTWHIRFTPAESIFLQGSNPVHLLEELEGLGRCSVRACLDKVPALEELNPEGCYTSWEVLLETDKDENDVRDVFIFVEDMCRLDICLVDSGDPGGTICPDVKMTDREDTAALQLKGTATEQEGGSGQLLEAVEGEREGHERVPTRPDMGGDAPRNGRQAGPGASIRVGADKLDALVNLVGELVIVQARISQVVQDRSGPLLVGLTEELERLSNELRDSALNMRMVPIGTTFNVYKRLARDLSLELGKEIELVTSGAKTELDKTVIEKLKDPLVHLLRNSMDHGVERPDVRISRGKPAKGIIRLSAEHVGGNVVIRIQDDGAGIDAQRIRDKAIERGLLSPEALKSEQELFEYIFEPGFSTAGSVTSLSGRGVGMDVVKRGIEALSGSLGIESRKGQGTTVTVRIPLTLAIIEGLQVQVGGESFVLPLAAVEECVEIQAGGKRSAGQLIELRGDLVPFVRLRECFDVPGVPPAIEQVVVTGSNGKRLGIVVDHVIGEHQTVIKPLGRLYANVPGISGATVKGDGSMALILDVPTLMAGQEARA